MSRSKSITHECAHCGGTFHHVYNSANVYCSRECAFDAKATTKRHCVDCGNTLAKYSRSRRCRPCHLKHLARPPKPHRTRACPDCGEVIETVSKQRCSECAELRRRAADARSRIASSMRKRGSHKVHAEHRNDKVSQRTKRAVHQRDRYVCQICGEPTDPTADPNSDWYPCVDHIIPIGEWPDGQPGRDALGNLRCAHRVCNSVRSTSATVDEVVLQSIRLRAEADGMVGR